MASPGSSPATPIVWPNARPSSGALAGDDGRDPARRSASVESTDVGVKPFWDVST